MNAPVAPPVAPVVTLKVNGKPYACKNGPVKSRCGSKEFALDPLSKEVTYACTKCGWLMCSSPGFNVEALLPPRNDWRTPGGSVFEPVESGLWTTLHREYDFNVDLAADVTNRKTILHFDEKHSTLDRDWTLDELLALSLLDEIHEVERVVFDIERRGVRAFANPPYVPRGTIYTWLKKAIEQCERGVWSGWLIPMSSSVDWFNEFVVPFGQWTTFNGRIAFEDPLAKPGDERTSPKQDNLWVVFDPNATFAGHVAHRDAKTGEYLWRRS